MALQQHFGDRRRHVRRFRLAACAGDQPDSNAKEFAKDIEQLNGTWASPKMDFAPGITGQIQMKLEFKKDSTVGQATVLGFVSKNGVFVKPGPSWIAELKEKDKKRLIVLSEMKGDKRTELTEIAYEVIAHQSSVVKMRAARAILRAS